MNKQSSNSSSLTESIADDWVISSKSIYGGGLIVEHQIEPPDEVELGKTNHHFLGYLFNDFSPRQITRMDGKEYDGTNRSGDFWLKPASVSGYWRWESTDDCLIFGVEPTYLEKVALENNCLNPDKIEILPVLIAHDPQIKMLATQFKREMDNPAFGEQTYIESLANIFAIHLLREYCTFPATLKQYEGGLAPYKLKQALNYINDNLDGQIKLQDIAQFLDLSQFYFCHMFKESTGVAPYKYIIQQRVQKAKHLIKNSKSSLADIAYECGFSSQSQMTQHFRKHVGVTPRVYFLRCQ